MATVNRHWRREFVRYVCWTLPFAFCPIEFLWVVRRVFNETLTRSGLVTDGGILCVAIGLAADALLRLLASNRKWFDFKMVLAALAAWAIGSGSYFYSLRLIDRSANSVVFIDLCFLVLIVSIVLAGFCRLLPEEDDQ